MYWNFPNVNLWQLGFPNYEVSMDGIVYNATSYDNMAQCIHRDGYLYVQIYSQDGIQYCKYIHRLVAFAFIPTKDVTLQVNHIDGNKWNNWYGNLEWVTNLQNAKHAALTGLMPHAVIDDQKCHLICQYIQNGYGI